MKAKKYMSAMILVSLLVAATAINAMTAKKSTPVAVTETQISAPEESLVDLLVLPQDRPSTSRYGEDSATCVRNLSLYLEFYRQGNIPSAIPGWRWIFANCPMASQNMYIHGVTIVKYLRDLEPTPAGKEAYIDTLMMVYDQRITYFGHTPQSRRGSVLGRKAVDMMQFRPERFREVYATAKESVELEGRNSAADVLVVYMQNAVRMVEEGGASAEEVVVAFDRCMDIIDFQLKNGSKDAELYTQAQGFVETIFQPYATCDVLIGIYTARFEASPEDADLLEKITSMLEKANCTESKLFYQATLNLHKIRPTAQSAFLMGRLETDAKNFSKATEFFLQAIELYEDNNDKANAFMRLADIHYRQLRSFSQARSYALRAAELRPNDGRPYLLIGDMYAQSAKSCGTDEISEKAAYWAAVDKYQQARRIDNTPAVENAATQSINTWSQYFPSTEILFFHGLKVGDSYRVECWINETTTVRAR